jgi:anaerobic magnesium-protoporphyrin IX monomethyl ester cyclase
VRVVVLNPPFKHHFSRQSRSPGVSFGGTLYYPYYLAYATGVLEQAGFDEILIDAIANKWDHSQTLSVLESLRPDLLIMDTSTPSILNDLDFASKIKSKNPDLHLNVVGTHPTAMPEWTLKHNDAVDSVCLSEYDYTVRDLAFALKDGENDFQKIEGLVYRKNGRIVNTGRRELMRNLDDLPFVSKVYKKHLDSRNYFYASVAYPQVTILTARGCKYDCSFCNIPFKKSYRTRSPDNVIAEFEFIQNEMPGIKEVMIEDDTFGLRKDVAMEICEKKIAINIQLPWSCNLRVNTDYELLRKMKDAGCRLACVGFESPSDKSLNDIHKGITEDRAKEFMNRARDVGLLINGCFIIGLLGDTEESIRRTVEYARELFPDTAQFYPLMVYPGTEDYENARMKNLLITEDYSKWLTPEGHYITTLSQDELDPSKMRNIQRSAYKNFYANPEYIAYKSIQSIKNFAELNRNLRGFSSFINQVLLRQKKRTKFL